MTYMNESGRSVGAAMRFFKLPLSALVVMHDEIDLAAAKLKVKTGGGDAGNNGARSITATLGPDYRRVRIGIGHPGEKHRVHGHVLGNFSKADEDWLVPMLTAIAEAAPLLAKDDDVGFMNKVALLTQTAGEQSRSREKPRRRKTNNGIQMRHRRTAECRQVHALQCADADRGGAGGELSVLHHRAECRRRGGARSAPRQAGGDRQIGRDHPDPHHLRGHRRPCARRVEGRRPRQPVPRQHPRSRCHRACAALLRGRRHHPCRGQDRSGRRCRDGRNRTDARRSREPGEARHADREESQVRREGSQGTARADDEGAGAAARRQAGAPGRADAGRARAVSRSSA